MQRIINGLHLGLKRKCICPFSRKGEIPSTFAKFRLFWRKFSLRDKFYFCENRCNNLIFAKKKKKIFAKKQLFPFCRAHLQLSLAYFAKIFGKLTFSLKYMYGRKFSKKQTLSRKSANISCRPNIFPKVVPLSHMLLTSFAFLVIKKLTLVIFFLQAIFPSMVGML
jgi:hypothetical protein